MKAVLIIDDHEGYMEVMEKWLQREGYDAAALYKPPELQQALGSRHIDLILQDELLNTEELYNLAWDQAEGKVTRQECARRLTRAYAAGLGMTNLLRNLGYEGKLYVMVSSLDCAPVNLEKLYLEYGATNVIDKPFYINNFARHTLPLILDTSETKLPI